MLYEEPIMKIEKINIKDIIRTSQDEDLGGDSDGNDTIPYTWVKP